MKQGRQVAELAAELSRQNAAKRDFVAYTTDLTAKPTPDTARGIDLTIGEHFDGPLRKHAHSQIADRLKIPARYYNRMLDSQPALLAENLNTWFQAEPERRMVRTLDGGARAFLSDRYLRLDNADLVEVLLPILQEIGEPLGMYLASCEVTELKLYLKFVTPRMAREVKQGDEVQQGFVFSNSEVGKGSLSITPLIYRCICDNGMVVGQGLTKYHLGGRQDEALEGMTSDATKALEDRAFLSRVRDVTTKLLDGSVFGESVERMQAAQGDRIEGDVVKGVEVLSQTLSLSKGEESGVLKHLIEGGDLSRYGVLNAVTRYAQDPEVGYDRASELEVLGGRVLTLPKRSWREISEAA